jgi:hypothetical protein
VRVVHQVGNPTGTGVLMAESALVTVLGGLAAALTSLSYLPKVKKACRAAAPSICRGKCCRIYGLARGRLSNCGCKREWGNALICKIRDTMSKGATSPMACRIGG